jgi:hypothetical protein
MMSAARLVCLRHDTEKFQHLMANFLVNRRMNKSQQMRWSRRGADLLLQVRCAVYNGTLGSGFGQKFWPANDRLPLPAIAA